MYVALFAVLLSVAVATSESDRSVLLDIYQQCNGYSWPESHRQHWGTPDHCTWYGISCDANKRVQVIDLEKNNMRCELPESISQLSELQVLDISSNLVGPVPRGIKGLTRLERLKLYENDLVGSLPSWLGELRSLKEIGIVPVRGAPGLVGTIPESFSTLPLEVLVLDSNQLTGDIPLWVKNIPYIHLRENKFTGPCPLPSNIRYDAVGVNCPDSKQPSVRGNDRQTDKPGSQGQNSNLNDPRSQNKQDNAQPNVNNNDVNNNLRDSRSPKNSNPNSGAPQSPQNGGRTANHDNDVVGVGQDQNDAGNDRNGGANNDDRNGGEGRRRRDGGNFLETIVNLCVLVFVVGSLSMCVKYAWDRYHRSGYIPTNSTA
jgi:hypothetical protein